MDMLMDFFTQRWPFGPEVCLMAYAIFHSARVKRIERAGGKELFWAESLILTFFMAFGGGILAPFLLGKPPVFFVNDLMVPLVAGAWFLTNRAEGSVAAFLNTPVMKHVVLILAETARGNTVCGVVITAMSVLRASKYYSIPLWGPVLLGTIAGCGGIFLPLDKGLQGVKDGAPWPLQSAFYGAAFFHLMVHDPNVGPYLREAAGYVMEGEPVVMATTLVVMFFCACALAQTIWGPAFNPFTPAHNVVYRVTGVPRPGAVAAPPAPAPATAEGEDKPKEE